MNSTPPSVVENKISNQAQACEAKTAKAAKRIKELGAEAAFESITDPNGSFISGKSHVFCIHSENGVLLAHKVAGFVGFDMNQYKDVDNGAPYADILQQAQKGEGGWMTYWTYGSGPEKRETPGLKNMYFLKVPDENLILCCGYWEDS